MFGRTNHIWVEGEGMLHALYFQKGSSSDGEWSVFYNNRHLETETFKMEKDRAKPSFIPAVEGHALAILSAHLFNWMRFGKVNKDLSNTDVVVHGGKFYAVAETHAAQEFDILTLDAIGEWDINGAWDRPFTAHPKVRFCQPQPACRFISSFPAWFCSCMYMVMICMQKAPVTGELVIFGMQAFKPFIELGVVSGTYVRTKLS
ncbi:unnamed protein product [Linum tenue]|uniref:Uncharacterized protein n=1 Tax=Linum tenue TaxID=586396 RepID=A0AAV0HSU8_9ROSI|nr:unnamed protein product [Linum tenue]